MKDKITTELNIDLKFVMDVDMTEFNKQIVKVEELKEKKREYVLTKLPNQELIKSIISNFTEKLEALGYECVRNISYSSEESEKSILKDLLKSALTGNITPPPRQISPKLAINFLTASL